MGKTWWARNFSAVTALRAIESNLAWTPLEFFSADSVVWMRRLSQMTVFVWVSLSCLESSPAIRSRSKCKDKERQRVVGVCLCAQVKRHKSVCMWVCLFVCVSMCVSVSRWRFIYFPWTRTGVGRLYGFARINPWINYYVIFAFFLHWPERCDGLVVVIVHPALDAANRLMIPRMDLFVNRHTTSPFRRPLLCRAQASLDTLSSREPQLISSPVASSIWITNKNWASFPCKQGKSCWLGIRYVTRKPKQKY